MFRVFAYAQEGGGAAAPQASFIVSVLPFILIILVFYFLIIRPQKKQQEKHKEMVDSLQSGDKVITAGGIIGTVSKIKKDEDAVVLFVDGNTKITVQRNAVSQVVKTKEEKANVK